jgi:hypothetical protein
MEATPGKKAEQVIVAKKRYSLPAMTALKTLPTFVPRMRDYGGDSGVKLDP